MTIREALEKIQKYEEHNQSELSQTLVTFLTGFEIREALTLAWHEDKNYAMAASVLAYEQARRNYKEW